MGRKQRLFTGAARDAAKLMATNWHHPGCGVAATFAQVDHMAEWSDNGTTNPDNSSIACQRHNPTKHTHYQVKRTGHGYVITTNATAPQCSPPAVATPTNSPKPTTK